MHVLDEPVWTALTTRHKHLAIGGGSALRYPPNLSPLAAVLTDDTASMLQLSSLFAPGETIVMVRKAPVAVPPGFTPATIARLVQMVATRSFDLSTDPRVERLTSIDEDQIFNLATLARPGPFARHTMRLGEFWGIKQDGRLVAMAGERLR
ncbi:GNAT family N-acetyltransferase, partial [bacterium]